LVFRWRRSQSTAIQDFMRHSYASHWLKAFDDKGRLPGDMGHATGDMPIDNYLRAVDRKTAAHYWLLGPPATPGNVVPMPVQMS
jgi:hypothetical protein